MGDFNVNLLSGNKMLLVKQYYDSYSQAPSLVKKYMDLCFSHSLHQLIAEPARMNSEEKVIQSGNGINSPWAHLLYKKNVTFETE